MPEIKNLSEEEMREMALEARRRQDSAQSGGASTLNSDETCEFDFNNPEQQFAVINFANTEGHPHSLKPAFRVLKFCETQEEAVEFAEEVNEVDPVCALLTVGVHGFYPISVSVESDPEEGRLKVNRNIAQHLRNMKEDADEFAAHKAELTQGTKNAEEVEGEDVGPSAAQRRIEENIARAAELERLLEEGEGGTTGGEVGETERKEDTTGGEEEEEKEVTPPPVPEVVVVEEEDAPQLSWKERTEEKFGKGHKIPNFPRDLETRNQSFFSFVLLKDYEAGTEPAIYLLQGFATDEDSKRYNKCVAAKQIDEHDIHSHAMYEWVYPHLWEDNVTDRLKPLYRNEEENNIMSFAHASKANVEDFSRQYERRGEEVPVREIEADLAEPAPRVMDRTPAAFMESGEDRRTVIPVPEADRTPPVGGEERQPLSGFDDAGGEAPDESQQADMPEPDYFGDSGAVVAQTPAESGLDRTVDDGAFPAPDL